jgi:hypothetical protein
MFLMPQHVSLTKFVSKFLGRHGLHILLSAILGKAWPPLSRWKTQKQWNNWQTYTSVWTKV